MKGYISAIVTSMILALSAPLLFAVSECAAESFQIALEEGENLISMPLQPSDTSIGAVISSVTGQYTDAWAYDSFNTDDRWKHHHPDCGSFSDLSTMTINNGYWICANQAALLTISGTAVSTDQAISLRVGWNLIGWPFTYSQSISEALPTLAPGIDYDQISRFNPSTKAQENYFGQPAIDQFDTFEPGRAYYVHALRDCSAILVFDTAPPAAPTVNPVNTPTNEPIQTLSGTKDSNSSIWINGIEQVPIDDLATWSVSILLEEGNNELSIISKDSAGNESQPALTSIFLDTTPPTVPFVTDDGDITTYPDRIHATWSAEDAQTGIAEYQYAVGTSPAGSDVAGWTSCGMQTEITRTGLFLISGQAYYLSVRALNAAGSWSEAGSSNGISVSQAAPSIVNIAPADGGLFEVGDIVAFNIEATDSESDEISYKLLIDDNVAKDWNETATFDWHTFSQEAGIHEVTISVKDIWGNESSRDIEVYLAREAVSLPRLP